MTTTRPPLIRLYADEGVADLFAGGGGASTGIEAILGRSPDVAINHDREALAMHNANHPTTRHLREDVLDVDPVVAMQGHRCGFAWFSPDCTYHSKARGGAPFRDRNRARRVRGLIGIVIRWAASPVRPRVLFVENVEELEQWGPIGHDGRPDPTKKGASFQRWVSRLRNLGYAVEWRQLRASDFGAPTTRKRLFIIARCDGKPIVWPQPSRQPAAAVLSTRRTAADCIDFSLPVPSIFLTPSEAKAWAITNGVETPRRPLADATLRRIARGIQRFVLDSPDPFIIRFNTERSAGSVRAQRLDEPISTLDTSNRLGLVTPYLVNVRHSDGRVYPLSEPLRTIPASDREVALVAPTLINTRNGERQGQLPRILDIQQPYGTVTAQGSQGALVAAFLAKHNGGHEATGQRLERPTDTVTTRDQKALVTSHLLKLRGGLFDHDVTAQDMREPAPTLTAGGTHLAEVRAFLIKFYGTKKDGRPLFAPLDTVTTKERFGLVTVTIAGEEYVIVDIGMRMLSPRELFRAQGFSDAYEIQTGVCVETGAPIRFTKKAQTRMVGNSVSPHVAAAIVRANLTEAVA